MGGRPEPGYALCRVMSSEQTRDEQLSILLRLVPVECID